MSYVLAPFPFLFSRVLFFPRRDLTSFVWLFWETKLVIALAFSLARLLTTHFCFLFFFFFVFLVWLFFSVN